MPRLKRVSRTDLTIERRRWGRGFAYFDADGRKLSDKAFAKRVRALAIPPAWRDVRLAEAPMAHIQAYGFDDAGRIQYIYHPDWERRRAARKQRQLALLAEVLPRIRRRVRADLNADTGSKELAIAIAIALIDRTAMRVGRERYLDTNGTRGAGTIYSRDVKVSGETIILTFPAKSGKRARYTISDASLAAAIERIRTIPGPRLLMYSGMDGLFRALRTEEINRYLREIAGRTVTAKDFRTLHASAMAAEALAALEPGSSETTRRRQVMAVARQVAAFLQNTPTICRQSYIAPCLFTLFHSGKLGALWLSECERQNGLRIREARLGAILAAAG